MKKIKPAEVLVDEDDKKTIVHPEHMERELMYGWIWVFNSYEIVKKEDGRSFIQASFLDATPDGADPFPLSDVVTGQYNPFYEPHIFNHIEAIDLTDEEDILDFCSTFGLLGEQMNNLPATEIGKETIESRFLGFAQESLDYFITETGKLKNCLETIYRIQKSDSVWLKEHRELLLNKVLDSNSEEYVKIKHKDDITVAKVAVIHHINDYLGLTYLRMQLGSDNEFLQGYASPSLLGVAYYQLYEALTEKQKFERCLKCRSLFVPRKPNEKFCPPNVSGTHSSCQNSYNAMKRRAREWYYSGVKTVEQIATTTGRQIEEVNNWIKEYEGKIKQKNSSSD